MCEMMMLAAIAAALLFPYVSVIMLTKDLWKDMSRAESPAERKG